MTELTIVLATIVRAMRLELDPARPVELGVRLNGFIADRGMWMRPIPRA